MTVINVSHLMERKEDMYLYSASISEMGEDAGEVTWENSMDVFDADSYRESESIPWLVETDDELEEARDYFKSFGAWEDTDDWNKQTLNAVILQDIAASIRERESAIKDGRLEHYEEHYGGQLTVYDNGEAFYHVGD